MAKPNDPKKAPEANPQQTQRPNVKWDMTNLRSSYSNFCNANSTREEVVLNFGVNKTWERGAQDALDIELNHRIVLSADRLVIVSSLCALAFAIALGLPLSASGAGEPRWSQEEQAKWGRIELEIDPQVQEALDRGDLKALRGLLKKVNYYKDEPRFKVHAIHGAVGSGNLTLIEYLSSLGWLKECRKPNPLGCELIPLAAQYGRIGMIKWLMTQGFDVKEISPYGATALHSAVQGGKLETVKFLCAQGVDEKAKLYPNSAQEATALQLAKASRWESIVKYLESGQCSKK